MQFIKLPNLPHNKVKVVIVDYKTDSKTIKTLKELNIDVIKSCRCNGLNSAVDGHPDMQIHHLEDNKFICSPGCYDYYLNALKQYSAILYKGSIRLTGNYPYDIAYNVASVGNFVFCNKKYTDFNIYDYNINIGKKIIDIKQGYSKCSICIVSNSAIITSDKSIAVIAKENKIDVLLINEGHIELKPYNYGFIGGCSGLLSPSLLAFNGNIRKHPDYMQIKNFCVKYNVKTFSLSEDKLYDIGTIMPIIC